MGIAADAPVAEAELWRLLRSQNDAGARDQLAGRYCGYARVVAATYYAKQYGDDVDFADYYQFACVGMMEALDRFDPDRDVQFKTFAARRMHGAILDGVERMTEKRQQIAARTRLRAQRLEGFDGIDGGGAGRVPAQILGYVAEVGLGLALSWMLDGTGMIADEARAESIPFYRNTELRQLRERLLEMVAALPAAQRAVVRGHYLQGRPFEEIATQLEVTRGRVSQIHRQAIDGLRQAIRSRRRVDVLL